MLFQLHALLESYPAIAGIALEQTTEIIRQFVQGLFEMDQAIWIFRVIHEVATDLIVFIAKALWTTIAGVKQDSRVFNPSGGDNKYSCFNCHAMPRARTHHATCNA